MKIVENENGKKSFRLTFGSYMLILLVLIMLIFVILLANNQQILNKNEDVNNFYIEEFEGNEYYISDGEYQGEYDYQEGNFGNFDNTDGFEVCEVMSYLGYKDYCKKWGLTKKYSSTSKNYIVFSYIQPGASYIDVNLAGVEYDGTNANIYIWDKSNGSVGGSAMYVIVIPTEKNISNINIVPLYTRAEFNKLTGKYSETGETYTTEDNKIIAENTYIKTDNENLNTVFNNMIDAIIKEHTIKVISENREDYWDLTTAVRKYIIGGEVYKYVAYTDNGATVFEVLYNGSYDKDYLSNTRKDFIYDMFLECDLHFLNNPDIFDVEVIEEAENYVIIAKTTELRTDNTEVIESYYIDKENYLLTKTKIESEYIYIYSEPEREYLYIQDVIEIPKETLETTEDVWWSDVSFDKPIIYIYPEEEMDIEVKLGNPELLTTSYPKYNNGWKISAKPDGTLIDKENEREYYSLYWEGINPKKYTNNFENGFVVEGKDVAQFLEEKLKILGLNEKEAQEFIIYWLPKMEQNKYNYIRFEETEEINNYMPLIINPVPDTVIRIMMEWKALDEKVEIPEQQLNTVERSGYTVIEWGGTEIK